MTKLSPGERRVRTIRTRGGNRKHRALRLDAGSFSWASENVARKVRILDVVYNPANAEFVRTKTLTKNAIVTIDAVPFNNWYFRHYGVKLTPAGSSKESGKGSKKGRRPELNKADQKRAELKRAEQRKSDQKKAEQKKADQKKAVLKKESEKKKEEKKDKPKAEGEKAKPDQKDKKESEKKKDAGKKDSEKKTKEVAKKDSAKKEVAKKASKDKEASKNEKGAKEDKTDSKKKITKSKDSHKKKQKKPLRVKKWKKRAAKKGTLDPNLQAQFESGLGRLFACIASQPGQVGRADGYILEGEELEFYIKKMEKKKKKK